MSTPGREEDIQEFRALQSGESSGVGREYASFTELKAELSREVQQGNMD